MIYHQLLDSLFRGNSYLRNIDQKIKDVFISQSMGSFSSARKFSTFWGEPKTYALERRVGSCKYYCNHYWQNRDIKADMLTFINDQSSIKINDNFDCSEKCLIYVLPCNCCQKWCVSRTVDISS